MTDLKEDFIEANSGSLPRDIQHNRIQVASTIQLQDGAKNPRISPLTVGSDVIELVIPKFAVVLILTPDVADMRFGVTGILDGAVGRGFQILRDGDSIAIPVANGNSIHVRQDSAEVTLHFHFEMLEKKS